MRRQMLWRIADEVLTPEDLLSVCPDPMRVDSCAAAIVNRLQKTGATVPDDLAVPENWEGIYLSGNFDITHLSVLYEAGFRDINYQGRYGQTVLQVISLGLCRLRKPYNGHLTGTRIS